MTQENITHERLTDCINVLLDVDDATHREHQDLITRMITLLQDMRSPMPRTDTAIDSTPASPPAGVTGNGARQFGRYIVGKYAVMQVLTGEWRVWEYALGLHHENSFTSEPFETEEEAINHADWLHANAALPASGNADTVADSGNAGGE